jgi:serine/arginine repetitive matrix protein 2
MGGGSDVSHYEPRAPLDMDDEDSDVPDELREILKEREEEGEEVVGIPIFRASLTDHSSHPPTTQAQILASPAMSSSLSPPSPCSEDDTKKSFDFTGELRKLNESGASDRRSFVEQLENAFRTPARVDLRYAFVGDVPPLPDLPRLGGAFEFGVERKEDASGSGLDGDVDEDASRIVDVEQPSWVSSDEITNSNANADSNEANMNSIASKSRLVDVQEPSGLLSASTSSTSSSGSTRPSDGELDRSFRFGGLPRAETRKEERELTLSDIIPPPAHARSISLAPATTTAAAATSSQVNHAADPSMDLDSAALEDDSVLKSIYAKILEGLPPPVPRSKRVDPGVANSGVVGSTVRFQKDTSVVELFFSLFLVANVIRRCRLPLSCQKNRRALETLKSSLSRKPKPSVRDQL